MEQAIIVSTLLAPVITGLIQIIKQSNKVNNQYLPVVAIVVGILFGGIYAWLFNETIPEYLLGGLISGLGAVGIYQTTQVPKGDNK